MEGNILLVAVIFLCCSLAECHICVHKPPRPSQFKFGVHLETSQRTARSVSHNLRIHVQYDVSIDALSPRASYIVKSLLPDAVKFLSELLSVRQSPATVLLNRQCLTSHYVKLPNDHHEYCVGGCQETTSCGPVVVPQDHLQACYACNQDQTECGPVANGNSSGAGIPNADFILYVSAVATADCQGADMSAHASFCQLEAILDRPIAGYINLCPHNLSTESSKRYTLLTTIQHEIIHALGFSAALYAFYRDRNGQPLTPRLNSGLPEFNESLGLYQWSDRVIRPITRHDWDVRQGQINYTVKMIVTPRVVEEARAHFGCPTLEGIEVENHGGSGTEYTHFEKRLLANEAMTGTHTHERIFSRLTLAVMEDTGWYEPNYARANDLHWGNNLGCDFAKKSCKYWMEMKEASGESVKPYCNTMSQEPFQLTCDVGRAAVALCNLHQHNITLPPEYQYFTSLPGVSEATINSYGGSSVFADYCPFYQQFTYKMNDGSTKGTMCREYNNNPGLKSNVAAEVYGTGAVCIEHPAPWKQQQCGRSQTQKASGAGCYKVDCDDRGVTIVVEGVNYACASAGQVINVSVTSSRYLHTGQLICPSCEEICGTSCPANGSYVISSAVTSQPGDEGQCPRTQLDMVGICVEKSGSDSACNSNEKCCSNGCGHTCQRRVVKYNTDVPCSATRHASLALAVLTCCVSIIHSVFGALLSKV